MEPRYIYAESTVKPQTIETCLNTVYLRKDIVEENTDKLGNKIVFWTYQEAKLTLEEFNSYASFVMSVNAINGKNDSGNISQLVSGQRNEDNSLLSIMEAIVDLYDIITRA